MKRNPAGWRGRGVLGAVLAAACLALAGAPSWAAEGGTKARAKTCGFDPAVHTKRTVVGRDGVVARGVSQVNPVQFPNARPPRWVNSPPTVPNPPEQKVVVTYSIVTSDPSTSNPQTYSGQGLQNVVDSDFIGANTIATIKEGVESWNDTCGVILTYVPTGGQIRIGAAAFPGSQIGLGGWQAQTNNGTDWWITSGFVQLDSTETWTANGLRNTTAHEVGHALGLNHTDLSASLMAPVQGSAIGPKPDDRWYIQFLYNTAPAKLSAAPNQVNLVALQIERASPIQTGTNSNDTFDGSAPSPKGPGTGTGSQTQDDVDHYVVQRKAPGESVFSDLNTNVTASSGGQNADPELSHAANQFTFTDATQTVAGTYTYRVKAVHVANGADAVWSSEVAVAVTLSGIAANDSYTVNEDTPLVVAAVSGVLANDDTSGGALSVVSTDTLPSNGTLTGNAVNTDGSFTYTPNANFNGTDQFTYTATNGTDTDSATVTITVNAVNDPPVAVGGGGNVDEDNTLSASVPAASDVDLDPLTYVQDTGPTHAATFTLNTDGSFSYTPAANYNGPDSFTFHANDGTADSNTVTYNITVNSVNDQPLALITNEGSTFSGSAPFSLNLSGVNSTDVEDGTPPTFLWDFGDGSGDTVMDPPAHLYAAPGVYTVSLIVTDSQSLASVPVTAQVTVSGGAGDGDLYAKRGLFTINWKAHNGGNDAADLITLSGNFNLNGVPADLTGVSVRLDINGTQLGTSQTLDAAGRFTSARTAAPNYRYLLRSNRGTYSVRVSKTDLRSFIPGFNSTIAESGQVLVEVRLLLSGGGLAAPVDVSNFLRFDYTTRANLNTRGRFIFTRHDSLNGAFLSRRTIATEPRSGGGHVISARGFIAPAGGGPLLPMDDPNAIVVTVGTLAPITIPFAALNVRGLTPERSSYTYSRTLLPIPALKRFQINNARRSFVLTTALGDAGIPLSDDLVSTSHVLSIQVDVLTASGTFTFTTQVELLRNLLRLKRWLR